MFKGLSLNAKMLLTPIALMAAIFTVGLIGYQALSTTTGQFSQLADKSIPNIRLSDEMFLNYQQIRISIRTLGMKGITKADENASIEAVGKAIDAYEKVNATYAKIDFSPGEKELYEVVQATWVDFKATGGKVLALHASGKPEDYAQIQDIFFNECPAKAKVYTAAITALVDFHRHNAETWSAQARDTADKAKGKIFFAIVLGGILGILLTVFTVRSVSGLIGSISRVVRDLTEGATTVSGISESISEASQKLSASSTEQAAAIQQTTTAVEETSQMVQKNANNAQKSAEASRTSQSNAENGKRAVADMIQSIEGISASNKAIVTQIEDTNNEMNNIVNLINEIGDKTKVINDIVFQTKLLSFNASVEAARAGEHGKGFAVVAEEVGSLAAMSGKSAKEISTLLDTSTKRVQEIVAKSKEKVQVIIAAGTERVNAGMSTANNCDAVLGEIVSTIQSVNSMVNEIATASQEQSRGIQEINKAVTELDTSAQENASTSQTAETSAQNLAEQVTKMHRSISSLNQLVKGGNVEAPSAQTIAMPMREARRAA